MKKVDPNTDQLSAAISRTRDEMGGTIDKLQSRLSQGALKDEVVKQFQEAKETIKAEIKHELSEGLHDTQAALRAGLKETVSDVKAELSDAKDALREATIGKVEIMVQNTKETITSSSRAVFDTLKNNPIPAVMLGVGLAWLYASSRTQNSSQRRLPNGATGKGASRGVMDSVKDQASEMVHGVEHLAQQATAMVTDASHSASSAVEKFASQTKTSAMEMAHDGSAAVSRFADDTSVRAKQLGTRAEQTFSANPIWVGASLVAAGAAIGYAIPISQREVQWMGKVSEEAMQKAGELASEAWSHVDEAAREAAKQMNGNAEESA